MSTILLFCSIQNIVTSQKQQASYVISSKAVPCTRWLCKRDCCYADNQCGSKRSAALPSCDSTRRIHLCGGEPPTRPGSYFQARLHHHTPSFFGPCLCLYPLCYPAGTSQRSSDRSSSRCTPKLNLLQRPGDRESKYSIETQYIRTAKIVVVLTVASTMKSFGWDLVPMYCKRRIHKSGVCQEQVVGKISVTTRYLSVLLQQGWTSGSPAVSSNLQNLNGPVPNVVPVTKSISVTVKVLADVTKCHWSQVEGIKPMYY